MARARLDVDDRAFRASLLQAERLLEAEAADRVGRARDAAVDRARQLAPVATGRLASSITARDTADGRGRSFEIVVDVPYGLAVEFGTSDTDPQPFLRPALAEAARRLE